MGVAYNLGVIGYLVKPVRMGDLAVLRRVE